MIKNYKKFNESIRDLLVGPTEEEIRKEFIGLSSNEIMKKSIEIGWLEGVKDALSKTYFTQYKLDEFLKDAVENNYYDIVELLLKKGAYPLNKNGDDSAIDIANWNEDDEMIELLKNYIY